MKYNFFLFLFFTCLVSSSQTINLNESYLTDYLRTSQLLGNFKSDISFTLKPLDIGKNGIEIDKEIFEILLFAVLTLAGVLLLVKFQSFDQKIEVYKKIPKMLSLLIGASIGFVSGVVGIGGGIFLSPILLLIKVDSAKNIATAASLFKLINSLSGLAGQFTKASTINGIYDYWPLFLFVLIGGQIGNYLNLKIFPARMLALVTSALVIFVAIRMGLKLFA